MPIVYAYNIESPLARRWKAAEVFVHDCRHFTAFMPIHRSFCRLYVMCAPCFDLHKTKNIFFPTDQIDLAAATRRAEVSNYHGIAQLPEVEISCFLASAAGALVRRRLVGRQNKLCQPVQGAKGRVRTST